MDRGRGKAAGQEVLAGLLVGLEVERYLATGNGPEDATEHFEGSVQHRLAGVGVAFGEVNRTRAFGHGGGQSARGHQAEGLAGGHVGQIGFDHVEQRVFLP